MTGERLSLVRAAYVVARRDFTAILFSRAFFFFLLGPLFPILVGAMAGGIGAQVESAVAQPQIGLAMALAMWETRTNPNTWRQRDSQTLLTLAALKTWGYATAEIEDRMLTEAHDDNTDTTP